MKNYLIVILSTFILIGCDDKEIIRTDAENRILEIAYNRDYIYPDGFYHEIISEGSIYYENTVSIKPLSEREGIWIELSTNDRNEAILWSNNSNEYSSVHREIMAEKETDKYFEFKRQSSVNNNDIILSRIHKTSYFQPELDLFKQEETETIGIFNGELDEGKYKELVEYLWSCGSTGHGHTKVIKSQTNEFVDYYKEYIQSIQIVYGDFGVKDVIHVFDNYFIMNKTDKKLILISTEVETIDGRDN